ncbi:CENP-Q, a CENPA-CAD centromere complex subunit-domain-containing protein [Pyrenochaeta sp. MPI-SDFR-AT-0127]|nr:CENP-Q, a CENPA-CAD centromere complex subunit-domain-containing protein [Pyrenochaeta sp. MPI-SDFR-AT-0127]
MNCSQPSRTRKRKADVDDIAQEEPRSHKKYVQLETRTKRIPQDQIDTWPQVSPQVLEQIIAVVRDAKKDIANTQRDERKVITAHNALNPLVKRLSRQLSASRIPPQAKDIHFNIDKLTERNAQVSREVTTARHSKQLLSEQVKIAQNLLEKDDENLNQLKKNAKKWRTEWKHQEKHGRLHPLLQDRDSVEIQQDGPDAISLKQSKPADFSLLAEPDAELASVLEQLRRSLDNMQGNHTQVEGIDEAMRNAQAALDDVLFRHASAQQYAAL